METIINKVAGKYLRIFIKNWSKHAVSLKLLRGEGHLTNLELDEEALNEMSQYPNFLVRKCSIGSARFRASITKLSSEPAILVLDDLYVEVYEPQQYTLTPKIKTAALWAKIQESQKKPSKTALTKYGIPEKMRDGMRVEVHRVRLHIITRRGSTIDVSIGQLSIWPTDEHRKQISDLSQLPIMTRDGPSIFKECSLAELSVSIGSVQMMQGVNWNTSMAMRLDARRRGWPITRIWVQSRCGNEVMDVRFRDGKDVATVVEVLCEVLCIVKTKVDAALLQQQLLQQQAQQTFSATDVSSSTDDADLSDLEDLESEYSVDDSQSVVSSSATATPSIPSTNSGVSSGVAGLPVIDLDIEICETRVVVDAIELHVSRMVVAAANVLAFEPLKMKIGSVNGALEGFAFLTCANLETVNSVFLDASLGVQSWKIDVSGVVAPVELHIYPAVLKNLVSIGLDAIPSVSTSPFDSLSLDMRVVSPVVHMNNPLFSDRRSARKPLVFANSQVQILTETVNMQMSIRRSVGMVAQMVISHVRISDDRDELIHVSQVQLDAKINSEEIRCRNEVSHVKGLLDINAIEGLVLVSLAYFECTRSIFSMVSSKFSQRMGINLQALLAKVRLDVETRDVSFVVRMRHNSMRVLVDATQLQMIGPRVTCTNSNVRIADENCPVGVYVVHVPTTSLVATVVNDKISGLQTLSVVIRNDLRVDMNVREKTILDVLDFASVAQVHFSLLFSHLNSSNDIACKVDSSVMRRALEHLSVDVYNHAVQIYVDEQIVVAVNEPSDLCLRNCTITSSPMDSLIYFLKTGHVLIDSHIDGIEASLPALTLRIKNPTLRNDILVTQELFSVFQANYLRVATFTKASHYSALRQAQRTVSPIIQRNIRYCFMHISQILHSMRYLGHEQNVDSQTAQGTVVSPGLMAHACVRNKSIAYRVSGKPIVTTTSNDGHSLLESHLFAELHYECFNSPIPSDKPEDNDLSSFDAKQFLIKRKRKRLFFVVRSSGIVHIYDSQRTFYLHNKKGDLMDEADYDFVDDDSNFPRATFDLRSSEITMKDSSIILTHTDSWESSDVDTHLRDAVNLMPSTVKIDVRHNASSASRKFLKVAIFQVFLSFADANELKRVHAELISVKALDPTSGKSVNTGSRPRGTGAGSRIMGVDRLHDIVFSLHEYLQTCFQMEKDSAIQEDKGTSRRDRALENSDSDSDVDNEQEASAPVVDSLKGARSDEGTAVSAHSDATKRLVAVDDSVQTDMIPRAASALTREQVANMTQHVVDKSFYRQLAQVRLDALDKRISAFADVQHSWEAEKRLYKEQIAFLDAKVRDLLNKTSSSNGSSSASSTAQGTMGDTLQKDQTDSSAPSSSLQSLKNVFNLKAAFRINRNKDDKDRDREDGPHSPSSPPRDSEAMFQHFRVEKQQLAVRMRELQDENTLLLREKVDLQDQLVAERGWRERALKAERQVEDERHKARALEDALRMRIALLEDELSRK